MRHIEIIGEALVVARIPFTGGSNPLRIYYLCEMEIISTELVLKSSLYSQAVKAGGLVL